ncbi:MAG: polysaccharide export protein [Acidobacteriia bacterium]|nr:polysaccharide export protein [Terriglobia bacterium]
MRRMTLFPLLVLLLHWASFDAAPQRVGDKAKATTQGTAQAEARPSPKAATDDPTYIIGADDMLDISVWKETDVSRTVPVRPDGKISLPLLNDVPAAGLTPMQLQQQITEKLRKFLTEPQVTVIVTQINSRRVYIMGEVNRPGMFPLLPNMTILQLVTTAGGFTQFANTSKVRLLRNENGKQVAYSFNYKEVLAGRQPEQNLTLKPGDSIVVP